MTELGEMVRLFAPLQRVDDEARMVYGVFVSDTPVQEYGDTQVVLDWEATRVAVDAWRAWGNIREMHGLVAAGVAREIDLDEEHHVGRVGAYIVDDPAWKKVKAGVYKGYSVGLNPRKWEISDDRSEPVRVTDYEIVEVSLVDRPKDPTSVIEVWRVSGADAAEFVAVSETVPETAAEEVASAAQEEGGATVVLQRVWELAMGDTALPEVPEEALALLRAALAPVAEEPATEPDPVAEPQVPAEFQRALEAQVTFSATLQAHGTTLEVQAAQLVELQEELQRLAQALSVALERVQQLEQTPVQPSVQRRGEPEVDLPARIAALERVIRAQKLTPETPEVRELARLYQRQRMQ